MYRLFWLFILIALPTTLSATTYDDEWPIYVYGDVTSVANVYNYIAMLVNDGAGTTMLFAGATIGLLFAAHKFYQANLNGALIQLAWVVAISAFFLNPNATVRIMDKRTDHGMVPGGGAHSYTAVANIPFYLAASHSFASSVVYALSEAIDSAMAPVNADLGYTRTGFAVPFEALMKLTDLKSPIAENQALNNALFDISSYVKGCVAPTIFIDNDNSRKLLAPSTDMVLALAPSNFGISASDNFEKNGVTYNCANFYTTNISNVANTVKDDLKNLAQGNFSDLTTAGYDRLLSGISDMLDLNAHAIGDIKSAMYSIQATRMIQDGLKANITGIPGIDASIGATSEKSQQNLITEGLGSFSWTVKIMPMAMHFLTLLIVALYYPMALVAIIMGFDKGLKMLTNYTFGLVAFETVHISLAMIQNLVSNYAADQAVELYFRAGENPFSPMGMTEVVEYSATMAGMAGMLGIAAIPLTIAVIFKGETMAAVGIASSVKGMYAGNTLNNGTDTLAHQKSNIEATRTDNQIEGVGQMRQSLKNLGIEAGTSDAETARIYNQVQSEMNQVNSGMAAMGAMSTDTGTQNLSMGQRMGAEKAVNTTMGMGAEYNNMGSDAMSVAQTSGYLTGAGAARADKGMVNGAVSGGVDNYLQGVEAQSANRAASTAGYGSEASTEDAIQAGFVKGGKQGRSDTALADETANAEDADNYMQSGYLEGVQAASDSITVGEKGSIEAFRAAGNLSGLKKVGEAQGALNSQVTKEDGSLNDGNLTVGDLVDQVRGNMEKYDAITEEMEKEATGSDGRVAGKGKKWQALNKERDALVKDTQTLNSLANKIANGEEIPNSEYDGFIAGVERQARSGINKTIGVGKAGFQDKNGNAISEEQYMANIQKGAAMAFATEGIKGEAAATQMNLSHDERGYLNAMKLKKDFAQGTFRNDAGGLTNTEAKSDVRDENGNRLSNREYLKNTKAGAIEKETSSQMHASEMREDYGDELRGSKTVNGNSRNFSQVVSSIEGSKIDSQFGQAVAVDNNIAKGVNYAQNALFSEMSRQQSTAAKIATQGGVDQAVATDVAEASMKAASQQGATQGQIQEMAKSAGMSEDAAKKFSEAIIDGAKSAKELIASGITGAAASLAQNMSAGKTASDVAKTSIYGSSEEFAEAQARTAKSSEVKNKALNDIAKSPDMTQNVVNEEMAQAKAAGILKKYKEDGLSYGFLKKDAKGNITAASGDEWVTGRAMAAAGSMDRDNSFMIGGARVNTSYNAATGEAISNVNGLRRIDMGKSANIHLADANNVNEAQAQELTELLSNPSKLIGAVSGKTYGGVKSMFESMGVDSEAASSMANAVSYGAGGVATIAAGATSMAAVESIQRAYNLATGKREAVKDANGKPVYDESKPIVNAKGDRQYTDANGQKVFQDSDTGEYYSQGKDGKTNAHSGEKLTPSYEAKTRVERGIVSKVGGKVWDSVAGKNSSQINASESLDKSTDNTDKSGTDNGKDYNHDDGTHKTPPNSNSEGSVTQKSTNGKPQTKDSFLAALEDQSQKLEKQVMDGTISDNDWVEKETAISDTKRKLQSSSGKVHMNDLKKAGIDTRNLDVVMDDKGFVDMDATDARNSAISDKLNKIKSENSIDTKMQEVAKTNAELELAKKRSNPLEYSPESGLKPAPDMSNMDADVAPKKGTSKTSKVLKALGSVATLAGVSLLANEVKDDVKNGDYLSAADTVAEGFDPMIVGYSTAKEVIKSASDNINNSNYGEALKDVATAPVAYGKNLIDAGIQTGKDLHENYDESQSVVMNSAGNNISPLQYNAETGKYNNGLQPTFDANGNPMGVPNPSDLVPVNSNLSAASVLQSSPLSGNELNTSFQNQISSLQAQQATANAVENMAMLQQFANPDAPLPGFTLQTQNGSIPFTQGSDGYMNIANVSTAIPNELFMQQMQQPGYANQMAELAASSPFTQQSMADNIQQMGGMRETDSLLMSLQRTTVEANTDSNILSGDMHSAAMHNMEYLEVIADVMEKMGEKEGLND